MKKFALLPVCTALLASAQMSIQPASISTYRAQGNGGGTLTITLRAPLPPALPGAPFSGKEERKSELLLPDGARITQPSPAPILVARDAQGRTRVERPLSSAPLASIPGGSTQIRMTIVEINDVVDGSYYVLDPAKKIAYRVKYSPAPQRSATSTRSATPQGFQVNGALIAGGAAEIPPQVTSEALGTKSIQGVPALGQKQTSVFPAGSRGNDRPITEVTETWTAPSLRIPILQTSKSPTASNTYELTNLSTVSPTPDQFRVPPGYEVRDQPEAFTVELGTRPATAPGIQR